MTTINDSSIPLCVDLDGTLTKSDLLFESIIYLLKKNLFFIFIIPFWLFKGKYFTKFKLLEYVIINVKSLPFNQEILNYIMLEKSKGRKIVLVTATAKPLADLVAEYLKIFDDVISSCSNINLLGIEKAEMLNKIFGAKQFDYIGDSVKDVPVWFSARKSYLVDINNKLFSKLKSQVTFDKVFNSEQNSWSVFISQIRIHQWTKNLIIFIPMILAHTLELDGIYQTIFGFFALCMVASTIYLINDLADIESDRNHSSKKNRPIASGKLKISSAFKLIPILIVFGFGLAFFTSSIDFMFLLGIYFLTSLAYSFYLKKLYLIDIIILSFLYTLRLLAGGVISETTISPWLFSFSLFIFLSLGALKRYTELKGLDPKKINKTRGRDYFIEDIPLILTLGISSGIMSTLILALYINNPAVVELYIKPELLFLIIPVLFHWILRLWFIAHRGNMNDDPIIFAIKDKSSYISLLIIIVIGIGATL
ncbi:UbiA family prenyltransferase [Candidatus Kapaibacterium sp.]